MGMGSVFYRGLKESSGYIQPVKRVSATKVKLGVGFKESTFFRWKLISLKATDFVGTCVFVWVLACHSTAKKSEDSFLGFFHQEGPRNQTQVIWFVQQASLPTESSFWLRRMNWMGAKRSSCKSRRSLVCQILVSWIPLIMYHGNKRDTRA